MGQVFSATVGSAAWIASAHQWIASRLAESGRRVTGEIEQPRVRCWSTQLVVPTDDGTVWFKANADALAYEPAVHAELARLEPDEVEAPLAVDEARGWMMTRDRGTTLGDSHDPTLEDWQSVVRLAASLQRRVVPHADDLLAAGLPDCSPSTVPARFDELVIALAALPTDHPSHLDADGRDRLVAGRGVVEEAVAALEAGPMAATFQHGDLHPWNVFAVDGGLRIFDFGDAMWSHPLEILAVPHGYSTRVTKHPWPQLLDAYAAEWSDVIERDALEALMVPAMVTHAVNRAWTWSGAIAQAAPDELVEWGDAPLHYLRLALEPFPPPPDPGAEAVGSV